MYFFSSALSCTSFNYALLSLILKKDITSCMESSNVDIEQLWKFKAVYYCDTCLVLLHSEYINVNFDACTVIYQRYSL